MNDKMEVQITEVKKGSALVVTIDTEYSVKSCTLTKKYEAKIVTESGVTHITEPLIKNGTFVALIWQHTRYAFKIAFLESDIREDILC